MLRPKELFVGRLLSRKKSIERFFMYLLVKSVVPLPRHTSKYDLATDIASVNKVSVDLFCCMSSLFVVNLIHNLFIGPLIFCTRDNGFGKCLPLSMRLALDTKY